MFVFYRFFHSTTSAIGNQRCKYFFKMVLLFCKNYDILKMSNQQKPKGSKHEKGISQNNSRTGSGRDYLVELEQAKVHS